MKPSRILRVVLTVLAAAATLAIAVSYQAVLERLGLPQAVADQVAPEGRPSPLVAFVTSPLFLIVSFGIICLAVGAWLDTGFRAWDQRRAHRRWWEGLHVISVKGFSSLVADIPETQFENSPRAKAVAAEILSYINSGHIRLAMELKRVPDMPARLQEMHLEALRAPYELKNVGPEATVFINDLHGLARARKWKLPWPIPAKEDDPPHRRLPPAGTLGGAYPNALQGVKRNGE